MEIRLSGEWEVRPVPLSESVIPDRLPPDGWRMVAECAHLQPALYPERSYWGEHLRALNEQAWVYRREFVVPDVPYRRARLRFEGVDYFASVWVNRRFVGKHEGHFAPFEFEVTGMIDPRAENTLVVRVSAPWDAPNPRGTYPTDHVIRGLVKGLYEHGEGVIPPDVNPIGIWRPVWLLLDDGVSLDHIRIYTDLNGRVDLRVRATNATPDVWEGTLELRIEAENHTGGGALDSLALRLPPGTQSIDYALHIPEPRLWWPWDHGAPDLYRLEASLQEGGQTVSQRRETFGVRTVRLERSPERFVYSINERPVFIRGTSYMPGLYLSECHGDRLARDIGFARAANLNLLRVHVHVSPPELYDLCDRAGMLVWQDFELNWVHDCSEDFERRARAMQREMIDLLFNHPSIMTWTCHNEPTMVFARRHNLEQRPDPALYADAVQQDATRPVFICSGQMEDDWQRSGDVHSYYGALWTRAYTDIYRHRFKLNTEFGFEAPAAASTLQLYPEVWERLTHLEEEIDDLWRYQAALIQYQVEHLRRLRVEGCAGYVHFWLVDLVPQVGCGVLDSRRQPKGGYDALRRASQPLQIMLEHDGRRPRALWLLNDTTQAHSNATIQWRVYDNAGNTLLEGQVRVDITANCSQRVMPVNGPFAPKTCARIELTILDHEGRVLAENRCDHPFQPLQRPRGYPWKFDRYLGTKTFDRPGAPSLADQSGSRIIRVVPLIVRERVAEWALRQKWPSWLVSGASRLVDSVLG